MAPTCRAPCLPSAPGDKGSHAAPLRPPSRAIRPAVRIAGAPGGTTARPSGRASHVCAGLGFGRKRKSDGAVRKKDQCPCGSELAYADCCEKYHNGDEVEPTAEALMRARYSAYVKKLVPYICESTHPDNPAYEGSKTPDGEFSSTLEEDVRATCRTLDFQGLEVLEGGGEAAAEPGSLEAVLKIKVSFKVTGQKGYRAKAQSLTEMARFVREADDARWLFIGSEYV